MTKLTSAQIIESAIVLAHAILATDALIQHKRELLDICIWKVSEANGKYGVRYWSAGVLHLVQEYGGLTAILKNRPIVLRHEHVNTRKSLVDAMLADATAISRILKEDVIACLVTTDEHPKLSSKYDGFARYLAADIQIWDTQEQGWLIFPEPKA
jgi:hypothetical protein